MRRFSRPRSVPTKMMLVSGATRLRASARASPGKMWPPVPPAAMTAFTARRPYQAADSSQDESEDGTEAPWPAGRGQRQEVGRDACCDRAAVGNGCVTDHHGARGLDTELPARTEEELGVGLDDP